MTIIDTITSFNVFFTLIIGVGLYLYYRKPSSTSSSSSTTNTSSSNSIHLTRALAQAAQRSSLGIETATIDEQLQRTIKQIERQERDMIRQEQDEAYQKSLKADREKKLKREAELKLKEAREKEERAKADQIERLHKSLTLLRDEIKPHIQSDIPDGEADVVKLVFKLPDGSRVKRNFHKTDKVELLYWFVFSLDNAPLQFKMTTNFPRRDLPGRPPLPEDFDNSADCANEPNCEKTLQDIQLTETQIIFVYDLEA